ncbi:MAG: hypothetical protein AAF573_08040 [Bacteroidota bacterium]
MKFLKKYLVIFFVPLYMSTSAQVITCGAIFDSCKEELIEFIQNNLVACQQFEGCTSDQLIYRSGRVGISTHNIPSGFKLAVKKGIISDNIFVELCENGGWCDYVFESDYNLLSLKDVEKHINEKGHLHKIPSAQQLKEEGGIEIRQIKLNQQEKVEEIFLHLIALNNRIKELKKEVRKLEIENTVLKHH